jgi:hypothetical protein
VATYRSEVRGPTSQRTVSSIDTTRSGMVIREDDDSIDVPLTDAWTVVYPSLAVSATRLADGKLVVDLVFLATPHRLEIELDPSRRTFFTHWPNVPLFGAGLDNRLASMHAPSD